MRREPHENVATVLVDPALLRDLELELMELDLWLWPVRTAPICVDGPRTAFQVRRRLIEARRGAWDCAATWIPVWISFGERWSNGEDPLPWSAHRALWDALETHSDQVRFQRRLGGVQPLIAPVERRAG
ncbi:MULTISPECIES: hypothetical protein [unclassified Nocardioides]|uniref:hypothetical protein n=1 Tax=unclassified Nocardioides TaxID=2615069 RepID=UPI0006F29989|nr:MULTISPECIES: hypothetical protein [unclassified Nocardioides]KRA32769.1 hypothetical protein ASD81_14755 [Nocardioides sp. Root614]KRA89421.1 hypothetical protein ASD84_15020 [Nocardioides sp. Root682]